MPWFDVQVMDPTRGRVRLRVTAPEASAVPALLGIDSAHILALRPGAPPQLGGQRLDLGLFSRELAQLLQAGVPVLEALQTLQEQRAGQAQGLARACEALQQGQALSAALGTQPERFDPLFLALVAAGERTGQLPAVLTQHAAYLRWTAELRRQLLAASLYPLLLLGAGAAVLLFLVIYVLPRFAGAFDSLGETLPAASAALLRLGVWAGAHPWGLPGALAGLLAAAVVAAQALRRHPRWASWLWQLPLLGPRLRTLALARLYRSLGLLLAAGIPLTAALQLSAAVLPLALRAAVQRTRDDVLAGQSLSQALQGQQLATPVALRMLRVGEGSGQTAALLQQAAAFHDEEAQQLADLVARTVNPLLMLLIGAVIGTVVVLMYLPIFSLMEQVG